MKSEAVRTARTAAAAAEEQRRIAEERAAEERRIAEQKVLEQERSFKELQLSFLAENAKRSGVVETASGLQYEILRKGSGMSPTVDDDVEVHYSGELIDGTKFDSSYDRDHTVTFEVNQVIDGFTEALQLMREGAKYRLYIPSELAYGEKGAGQFIPPNATLVWEVELIKVL